MSGPDTSVEAQLKTVPGPSPSSQTLKAQNKQLEETRLPDIANEYRTHDEPQPANALDPRIKLILRGTFLSADSRTAHAIIADASGNEKRYAVGDLISGGIRVHEIMAEKVILFRGEGYETLLLWPDEDGDMAMQAKFTAASRTDKRTSSDSRPIFKDNPPSFIDLVNPQPVHVDGKFTGFRLKPRKNNYPLAQYGLLQDDVVTSINAVDLDNPMKGMRALRSLSTGDYVNMTVRRNGEDFSLSFHIPK